MSNKINVTEAEDLISEGIGEQGVLLAEIALKMSGNNPEIATIALSAALVHIISNGKLDLDEWLDFIKGTYDAAQEQAASQKEEVAERGN